MVEAEAPSAAEEPQQEADGKVEISQSAEAPTSPGEMSLKPPKRLPKPDRDMYKQKEEAMHSTIKLRKARILEINNLLDGKRNQADSPQLVALKNKQSALRAAWDAELVSVHTAHHSTFDGNEHAACSAFAAHSKPSIKQCWSIPES